MVRRWCGGLALCGLLFAAPVASAQGESARVLFERGLAAFERGETAAACQLFEKSYALDGASGTLYNLAFCHQRAGLHWQARGEFLKLAAQMDREQKPDKARLAREGAAEAERHVPKLTLVMPSPNDAAWIELDGEALDEAGWSRPIPVAPGTHLITVGADGFDTASLTVVARGGGELVRVNIPLLVRTAGGPSPEREAGGGAPRPPAADASAGWTTRKTTGAVVGGLGVVAVGVGAVFGLDAISKKSSADDQCGGSSGRCSSDAGALAAQDRLREAQGSALVSTVAVGGGLIAAVIGGYLFFGASDEAPPSAGVRLAPVVGLGGAGLSLGGRY